MLLSNKEIITILFIKMQILKNYRQWGLGIGDWGLGIGDWGLGIGPIEKYYSFYVFI